MINSSKSSKQHRVYNDILGTDASVFQSCFSSVLSFVSSPLFASFHRKILPHYKYLLSPLAATQKPCFVQNRNILHALYVYNVHRDGLSDIFDNKEILGTRISQRVKSKIARISFLYF